MKSLFTFFLSLISLSIGYSQGFTYYLNGNPVNTTGWTIGGTATVTNDNITLTNSTTTQAGYVYYSTPQNLANCSQFTVSFDFRVTNSSSPTADGIAFWYITNPPSGFVNGGGIGLPSYPNGLVLILDTYNNNGLPDDNPLVALRKYDGNTIQYTEGSTVGALAPDVTYQSFITDGNWHTCTLTYAYGNISVSFDGNAPLISATTSLNITGYFGFSASTGALWATQSIKNVVISGAPNPDPPTVTPVTYCQFAHADTLTAGSSLSGTEFAWYNNPTGGTALPTPPVPNTDVPGTYTWYVSQIVPGCNLESTRSAAVVTVTALPHYDKYDSICPGGTYSFYGRTLLQPGSYDTIRPAPDSLTCDSAITLHLTLKNLPSVVINPSQDFQFCDGESGTLRVNNPSAGAQYTWLRNGGGLAGGNGDTLGIKHTGSYQVIGTLNGCSDTSSTVTVTINPKPTVKIAPHDPAAFCAGDTLEMRATPEENISYLWTPEQNFLVTNSGSDVKGIFRDAATKVVVKATNEFGCVAKDSIQVNTFPCCNAFVPTAFTPNGDGKNDYFAPILDAGQTILQFYVYNRYGQTIYTGHGNFDRWDGTYGGGKPADVGTYMYYLKYQCGDGSVHQLQGNITLVR